MSIGTVFQTLRTKSDAGGDSCITEPILASFPSNMPSARALRKMKFNIY
jgi:hypothetical protein